MWNVGSQSVGMLGRVGRTGVLGALLEAVTVGPAGRGASEAMFVLSDDPCSIIFRLI